MSSGHQHNSDVFYSGLNIQEHCLATKNSPGRTWILIISNRASGWPGQSAEDWTWPSQGSEVWALRGMAQPPPPGSQVQVALMG